MSEYINQSLDLLERYSGNPNWFLPTDLSNWDLIKYDLRVISETTIIANRNTAIGSDAYEEALRSGKTGISVIQDQMQQIRSYEFFALDGVLPVTIWIVVFVVFIFLALMSWGAYDGAQYDERNKSSLWRD